MSTVATTNTTADDDSITDLLKETSRDYLKGIGQGVSALLKTDGDGDGDGDDPAALTEEQRRLEREREKEHQRREDEYIAQQKRRVLEEEEQRRRRTATSGGAAPHQTSASPASPASHQMTFTLTSSLKKEYLGKAYTVRCEE
jgi:sRNA-binding protein